MKAIGMGVAVVLAALAIAPAAFADGSGGSGGAQAGVQSATTAQGASVPSSGPLGIARAT